MGTIQLGQLLVRANVLQHGQLSAALAEQKRWGGRLGEVLVRMNLITEDLLVRALAKQLGIPAIDLAPITNIPQSLLDKIPVALAREYCAVPVSATEDGKTLVVAMAEPQNLDQVDSLRAITRCRIQARIAGRIAITRLIDSAFGGEASSQASLQEEEPSFRLLDAQGQALDRGRDTPQKKDPTTEAMETLKAVETFQRKQAEALKAMIELLIQRGVFTREEYAAKLKR